MVTSAGVQKTREITRPFIAGQVWEFDVPANLPFDLTVLAGARAGIYATGGMLPRKSVVMPRCRSRPVPGVGEPPPSPVRLTEAWARMVPQQS